MISPWLLCEETLPPKPSWFQQWKKTIVGLSAFCAIIAILLTAAQAEESVDSFSRRPYLGVGLGYSVLLPQAHNSVLAVDDSSDLGAHISAGFDFSPRLSAELYFADLGHAGISFLGQHVGDVNYQVYGISAIGYLFNSRSGFGRGLDTGDGLAAREGLSVYARVGLGGLIASSDLDYHVDHPSHLSMGVGAEYGFDNGFAARLEYHALDRDQQYASVSLVKRFGQVQRSQPEYTQVITPPVVAVQKPQEPQVILKSKKPVSVQSTPVVYFDFDRDDLTTTTVERLTTIADELLKSDKRISLQGHTDWVADEEYNYNLSMRRARSVRAFLLDKGVAATRMSVIGFGETRPVSSNRTSEGRASNRRVVIHDM